MTTDHDDTGPDGLEENPEGDGGPENPPADLLALYEAMEWQDAVEASAVERDL